MDYIILFFAIIIAVSGVFLFNALPERWFCDYGQDVPPKKKQRLCPALSIPVFSAVMAAAWYFGTRYFSDAKAIFTLIFVFICLCLSASDFIYRILPDQFTAALAAAGAGLAAIDYRHFYLYLLGGLAGGALIYIIGLIGRLLFKAEAMGFGDVKLAGALGLACGLPGVLYALLISVFTGAAASVPLLFVSREKRRYLPFAPFLCLGAVAAIFFGRQIGLFFEWYASLI